MTEFSWQQWFVAFYLLSKFIAIGFIVNLPTDYFHLGWRTCRFILLTLFSIAIITGGFFK